MARIFGKVRTMKSLIVTGRCPYQLHLRESLRNAGLESEIYENWGFHFPDHVDALLALEPDIIHLQWPESLVGINQEMSDQEILDGFAAALPRLRDAGVKLFWTMHNRLPHNRSHETLWRRLYQVFADQVDVCCHHSACGEKTVRETYDYQRADHVILRHGYFHNDVHPALPRREARDKLGLPANATICLNVGSFRPDKQIKEVLDVFEGRDEWLLLAGIVQGEYGAAMADRGDAMPNALVHRGYTDNETVSLLANAADCFVFMQGEHHLTSGAPHLSQAHLLPQITLDYPYAREVMGDDAVYIPADDRRFEHFAAALDRIDPEQLAEYAHNLEISRQPWRWDVIANATKRAYQSAISSNQGASA